MRKGLTLLLALLLLPCGCVSRGDVSDYAFVLCLGFARGDTLAYRVTVLCALPQDGGEEGAAMETRVLSAEARTLFEAIDALNAGLPLSLHFARTSVILIATPLLEDGKLYELLDFSLGRLDIASDVRIMAAIGAMEEITEGFKSDADPAFSKTMEHIDSLAQRSGTVLDARCRDVREVQSGAPFDLVLPLIGLNGAEPETDLVGPETVPMTGGALLTGGTQPVSVIGSAVFAGERMVGILSGRHTQLLAMIQNRFTEGRMTWYIEDVGTVSLRLTKHRAPQVFYTPQEATVTLYLDMETEQPAALPLSDAELQEWVSASLENELAETFLALQAAHSDAMGFGIHARMQHPFASAWEGEAELAQLSVTFSARLRLYHGGGA